MTNTIVGSSLYRKKSRNKGSVFMPICSRVISRVTTGATQTFWRLNWAHDRDRWDNERNSFRTAKWLHCSRCWEDLPPFHLVIFLVFSVVITLWHIQHDLRIFHIYSPWGGGPWKLDKCANIQGQYSCVARWKFKTGRPYWREKSQVL